MKESNILEQITTIKQLKITIKDTISENKQLKIDISEKNNILDRQEDELKKRNTDFAQLSEDIQQLNVKYDKLFKKSQKYKNLKQRENELNERETKFNQLKVQYEKDEEDDEIDELWAIEEDDLPSRAMIHCNTCRDSPSVNFLFVSSFLNKRSLAFAVFNASILSSFSFCKSAQVNFFKPSVKRTGRCSGKLVVK